jgi:Domain of unknown function (DUF4189)
MKTGIQFLVLLTTFLALPAFSQGYTLATPSGWSLEWRADHKNKSGAPNANLTSIADGATASVSILQGLDAKSLSPDDLQGVLLAMAQDSFPQSLEGQGTVRSFGPSQAGIYLRLTDKKNAPDFKYMTYALHRKGPHLSLGVMLSNDDRGTVLPKLFAVLESIEVGAPPAMPPRVSPRKTLKPAAEDEVWSALATESNMTDNDPLYAFGVGDTRIEADKAAVSACLEEGAKRCTVRVTYKQCGAFAVSASGKSWGWGTGASKRVAEKGALEMCQGANCDILASDCN